MEVGLLTYKRMEVSLHGVEAAPSREVSPPQRVVRGWIFTPTKGKAPPPCAGGHGRGAGGVPLAYLKGGGKEGKILNPCASCGGVEGLGLHPVMTYPQ